MYISIEYNMRMYDVNEYSDEELHRILDLSSPTDSELEARILQMIQKYKYTNGGDNEKMAVFFENIYHHFFDASDEDEDPSKESRYEGDVTKVKAEEKEDSNVDFTRTLEYTKGKLNPILKETYKRTITIDSQYRDNEYPLSTDFTLNFTETLKDVVSLKLYAVQIPVTWYTINNNYGSNYFFLRPLQESSNTLGLINRSEHEYKVEVEPGNYTPLSLMTEINSSIEKLKNTRKDVSFGDTKIEYSSTNARCNLTVDLQKHYDKFCYDIDISGESLQRYLGITNYSHEISSGELAILDENISIDRGNDTITFIHYRGGDRYNTDTSIELERFTVVIENGVYGIDVEDNNNDAFLIAVTNALQTSDNLVYKSEFYRETTSDGYVYKFRVYIDRQSTQNELDSHWVLVLPFRNSNGSITFWQNYNFLEVNECSNVTGTDVSEADGVVSGKIVFRPNDKYSGLFIGTNEENNEVIDVNVDGNNALMAISHLLSSNPVTSGSYLTNDNGFVTLRLNINKVFTSRDYEVVFYDVNSLARCARTRSSYRNAYVDTTLGYILGYKSFTKYEMVTDRVIEENDRSYYKNERTGFSSGNEFVLEDEVNGIRLVRSKVALKGDSVVSVYLYNYFMIILDDFNQNHLNDGLVTVSKRDTSVTLPNYANRRTFRTCEDTPNAELQRDVLKNLTQKQLYSVNELLKTQNENAGVVNDGPFIKDMFALLPVKSSNAVPGTIYVEFGGTLQQQERVYFGPVNIRRLSVKLINDKGDVVDLNGANWSFQLVCEQLYQSGNQTGKKG